MPRAVEVDASAHPPAIAEGNNNQFPTTSRKAGSNGAATASGGGTAAKEAPAPRRSRRQPRPSSKVLENNEQQQAAREVVVGNTKPSANAKRKNSDSNATNGSNTSRRREQAASEDGDDADDADDISLSSTDDDDYDGAGAGGIDYVEQFRGTVAVAEEGHSSSDDDSSSDESDEENGSPNKFTQKKQSKMRGERPTGNVNSRASATDFTNNKSIDKHFPKYKDITRYGQRQVPKSFLKECKTSMAKAKVVTEWRKLTPDQQRRICKQISADKKARIAAEQKLKEEEKKRKQQEKDAAKLQKDKEMEAKKKANEASRKEQKRVSEQKRRAESKKKAQENPIASRHLNPSAAAASSFSQKHLDDTRANGKKRKATDPPTSAKHMNDQVARKGEAKMLKTFHDAQNLITAPEGTDTSHWLEHRHMLVTSSELTEAPRANGGSNERNTVNDPNYDSTKPLNMTVHCTSEAAFGIMFEHFLNSGNPIVQAKLNEYFERRQRGNADDEANPRAVHLTVATEMPAANSDRAAAERSQPVEALVANHSSNDMTREVVNQANMFV